MYINTLILVQDTSKEIFNVILNKYSCFLFFIYKERVEYSPMLYECSFCIRTLMLNQGIPFPTGRPYCFHTASYNDFPFSSIIITKVLRLQCNALFLFLYC